MWEPRAVIDRNPAPEVIVLSILQIDVAAAVVPSPTRPTLGAQRRTRLESSARQITCDDTFIRIPSRRRDERP